MGIDRQPAPGPVQAAAGAPLGEAEHSITELAGLLYAADKMRDRAEAEAIRKGRDLILAGLAETRQELESIRRELDAIIAIYNGPQRRLCEVARRISELRDALEVEGHV